MGVKNLTKLLQRYAPNSIKQKIIQDYRNKTLVLDGSIFLRKFVYSFSYENEEILHPHIYGFYRLLLFLKQNSINPIFIFDGKERISEKRKEIAKRNKNSETFEALEAKNHNLAAAYEKRVIPITWKMYLESINFIRTGGIPCIVLDGHEAEAMCASLVTHGFADATVSEDMDTTIFGDGILLRQFFKKNKPIVEISPVEVKKSLELSHDQYIDLCILCGTDFAGTIRNVGPVTALKLIKQYGSIENIL
ncbi:PIN domain-like protein, partial [Rhizophagus irregularis]